MASVNNNSLFKLSYGLFVVSTRATEKYSENGCIVNTVQQITNSPNKICVAINKANLTHDIVAETKEFNVSVLDNTVPFSVFEAFGFISGREKNKFDGIDFKTKSENNIYYLTKYTNAFISARVIEMVDCDTHTLFIAELTEAEVLSETPSVTYDYYFKNIKPSPKSKKKGFVCKICGYVYEGDTLPPDFICPLCKHGVEDFEPIE